MTDMTLPRIIVTRPQPEADAWVSQLQAHGVPARALPLIEIGPATLPADQQAASEARAACQRGGRYGAIMLVSGNAAQYFLDEKLALALSCQAPTAIKTRVWSPGPGTARAALAQGIPATLIDQPAPGAAQFDSESLWAQVSSQVPAMAAAGLRVLVVRGASEGDGGSGENSASGGTGRQWLATQLQAAGVGVDFVAVYERRMPQWTPEQMAHARTALTDGSIWLFSSSQAVMHLSNIFSPAELAAVSAITTHPRIAQAAQKAGFASVKPCRPTVADVIASLESRL
ncbi:uroporphyrinogen-III synthase [Comamonas odontotermitis]|uniref:uroporphyrinogen-III synthase n=1 Tax=Comamonas odontotermitis TaxID=379895 RepID=UPI00295E42F4|nr:uroporphyrinogen-III synthase [Comamonas odontotermitis]